VPSGLKKLFPNFNELTINGSDIETITKQDLDEYKNLKKFVCMDCKLEYLPGDLFQGTRSIEFIHFEKCNLKFIEPNLLDELYRLKHVKFCGDLNYSKCYSIYPEYKPNATRQELKAYLYEKMYEKHKPMLDLKISEGIKREKEILEHDRIILDKRFREHVLSEAQFKNQLKQLQESEKHSDQQVQQQLASVETKKENYRIESKNLKIFGERIKQENRELKEIKAKTIRENQKLKESQAKLTQQVQQIKASESKLKLENDELKYSKSKIQNQLQESINFEKQQNIQIEHLKTVEKKLTEKNQELEKMKTTLAYDLTSFTQNENTKDFRIIIEDQEFPVHKFLLAARSPTLAEILKNNPEVENLNLVDISVEIFEIILKFLYTDELPVEDGTNFVHLFAATGKLQIQELKKFAALRLIDQIDDENALEILKLSNIYDHDELKQKAFQQIKRKYPKIKFLDQWASNVEKINNVVKLFQQMEEEVKKLEEQFQNSIFNDE